MQLCTCIYIRIYMYHSIVVLSDCLSECSLARGGRAQHAHFAGDAGLGGQQVGPWVASELHQSLR